MNKNNTGYGGELSSANHFQGARKNLPNQGTFRNNNPQNVSKGNARQPQTYGNKSVAFNNRPGRSNLNYSSGSKDSSNSGSRRGIRNERGSTKTNKNNQSADSQNGYNNSYKRNNNSTSSIPQSQNFQTNTLNVNQVLSSNFQSTSAFNNPMTNSRNPPTAVKSSDTNNFQKKLFGSLLKNPESLGFQKHKHRPLKVPKYMLKENVLFDMSTFQKNDWDMDNQQMLSKREQEFHGEPQLLFEEFQEHRKKEREMMENLNLVDKENAKKSLDDAIVFRGSCEDMCPIYERVERVFKNQVSKWEKDPNTNKISGKLALKTFMRPSGQAPPLPSDVRPPDVLQKTLHHIIDNLIPCLPESQSFIWDRTRSIRQDFTFQNNYSGYESIDCHEKICRIHILSLHVMSGANDPDYQQQQEVEQFNNSLQTLTHMYDDVRSRGGFCPNEPEFRAYELISKIKDTELDRYLQSLPEYVLNDLTLQRAILLRGLVFEGMNNVNLFSEFFKAVLDKNATSFFLASLAEIHFNEIRYTAFRTLSKAYHSKAKKLPTAEYLVNILRYNDANQLLETCKLYGLPVLNDMETNVLRIDVTQLKSTFKVSQKQAYTQDIDYMTNGLSMAQIIKEGHLNNDLKLKQPPGLEQIARQSFKSSKRNTENVERIFCQTKTVRFTKPKVDINITTFTPSLPVTRNELHAKPDIDINTSLFNTSGEVSLDQRTNFNNNQLSNLTTFQEQEKPLAELSQSSSPSLDQSNAGKAIPSLVNLKQVQPQLVKPLKPVYNKNAALSEPNAIITESPYVAGSDINENNENGIEETHDKKLIDNPDYTASSIKFVDNLIQEFVQNTSSAIIMKQIENEQLKRKEERRLEIINKISNELFEAFLEEQLYLAALEAKAIVHYNKFLQHKLILKVTHIAKKSFDKRQDAKLNAMEIENFVHHVSTPNSINNFATPRVLMENKVSEFSIKSQINDIFDSLESPTDINFSLVMRAPNSDTSRWILNELGLSDGKLESKYIAPNGKVLASSLLPDALEPKKYFENISSILVQVGTIEGLDKVKKSTLISCLIRDSRVLKKLDEYMKLFSQRSSFSIIICYSDAFGHKMKYDEIRKYLRLDELKSPSVTIGFLRLKSSAFMIPNQLGPLKKIHNDLMKLIKVIWNKSNKRLQNEKDESLDTINCVSKNLDTSNMVTNDPSVQVSMFVPPRHEIKSRVDHISHIIGSSSARVERKRQKINLVNNCVSETRKPNNSLMLLRNYHESTTINNTGNSSHLSFINIASQPNAIDELKRKRKIEDLVELDKLAESILEN